MEGIAVVTGANAGLGLEVTRELLRNDFRVVMACRNEQKALDAASVLRAEIPNARIDTALLDVSSLASINEFARWFSQHFTQLHLLVNNAGITAMPLQRTDAGHESHLATNYLGPFALIGKLLPYLEATPGSRIVNVNSLAHRLKGTADLDDLNWEHDGYEPMLAYGRSKFALMMFTLELQNRLQRTGSDILAVSAHPGFAATEILEKPGSTMAPNNWFERMRHKLTAPLIPKPEKAARSTVFAALSSEVNPGDYIGPRGLFEIGGLPGRAKINPAARDAERARQLWEKTESMTGVSYLDQ